MGRSKDGFFVGEDLQREDRPSHSLASKLANAIKAKRLSTRPIQLNQWAGHFDRLLEDNTQADVSAALNWHIANIGAEFAPQAYSADGFRRKYRQIVSAMSKDPKQKIKSTHLAKGPAAALKIARELAWPAGFNRHLPIVIERSWQEYEALWKRVATARTNLAQSKSGSEIKIRKFLAHLDDAHFFPKPAEFVADWIEGASSKLAAWQNFSGSPKPITFVPDHPWFVHRGFAAADDYSDSHYWTLLMEIVG